MYLSGFKKIEESTTFNLLLGFFRQSLEFSNDLVLLQNAFTFIFNPKKKSCEVNIRLYYLHL